MILQTVVEGVIEFPETFPIAARDLIERLCTREPLQRLGCLKGGTLDVMNHRWFEGVFYYLRFCTTALSAFTYVLRVGLGRPV
jgi:hypothetical protein